MEFARPDRPPRDLWSLPIAWREQGEAAMQDFLDRWPRDFDGPWITNEPLLALTEGDPYEVGQYRDEWGCVFENIQAGVIGEVKEPLLRDWSRLEDLRPPVEALSFDVEAVNDRCRASDRFMMAACCPRLFERLQFLRGTEALYMDLARRPAELDELIRIVHEFYCAELEAWARTDVDALGIMDDWGSQQGLLMAPKRWRELFRPLYADYTRIAREAGKKFFMHSDGCIFDIYEDLIEIGVDAVNSQLFCMDIEEIGRRFAGRITFWGEIDRQWILPEGTEQDCRDAVARVVQ
ncbi:MAG: uroporphyrinogen decarboxylase family protein, partial [Phycisphaerales bacterium JB038]